jgi:hypothetical protein
MHRWYMIPDTYDEDHDAFAMVSTVALACIIAYGFW